MSAVFPIEVKCGQHGHIIWEFRDVFLSKRKPDVTWFCFDVIIRSRIDVTFVVFDMLDNCQGGKGKELYRLNAVVMPLLTSRFVEARIRTLAEDRRFAELQAAENAIIDGYANEIRAELEVSS